MTKIYTIFGMLDPYPTNGTRGYSNKKRVHLWLRAAWGWGPDKTETSSGIVNGDSQACLRVISRGAWFQGSSGSHWQLNYKRQML